MKAKESGTSAGTTSCKMPPSLCTHLHTAFHVCVATCEIQATLSFLPSSLPSLPDPSACAHHVLRSRRAAFRPHLVLKFEEGTVLEKCCSLLELQIKEALHIKF